MINKQAFDAAENWANNNVDFCECTSSEIFEEFLNRYLQELRQSPELVETVAIAIGGAVANTKDFSEWKDEAKAAIACILGEV